MSNVNLNFYRMFCKVVQSKSYSKAAGKLNLTVANIRMQRTNLITYFLMEKIEQVKKDYSNVNITIVCEVDTNKMLEKF